MRIARGASTRGDPFLTPDASNMYPVARIPTGLTLRNNAINPAHQTLVVILGGQSLNAGWCTSAYNPTNAASIDQLSLFDGNLYSPPSSALVLGGSGATIGNLNLRLYDTLITNGKFNRVIFCCIAIPSTSIFAHAAGGQYAWQVGVAMRRLAWRGITPSTTGTVWVYDWMIGESDSTASMSQADFTRGMQSANTNIRNAGFVGKIIVPQETWTGSSNANIRAAQAAVISGDVYSGGDMDTLTGGTNRQGDNIHPTDVGAAAMATIKYNAYGAAGIFTP